MKKIFCVLAFLSFFSLLGAVGASECNTISLTHFIIQSSISMICMVVFTKLAGGFNYNYKSGNSYGLYNCENRHQYLIQLADEYDIDINIVNHFANLLGEKEDFDALLTMIEDYLNMNIKIS